MVTIAEIADKMLTVPVMWLVHVLIAVPFVALVSIHRRAAFVVLPIAMLLSAMLVCSEYGGVHCNLPVIPAHILLVHLVVFR